MQSIYVFHLYTIRLSCHVRHAGPRCTSWTNQQRSGLQPIIRESYSQGSGESVYTEDRNKKFIPGGFQICEMYETYGTTEFWIHSSYPKCTGSSCYEYTLQRAAEHANSQLLQLTRTM